MGSRTGLAPWLLWLLALGAGVRVHAAAIASEADVGGGVPAAMNSFDAKELECFFDGLIPYAIDKSDIAGMAVAIVQNGRIAFEKGYGYADVVTRRPMSPEQTLIRPGSITKLFTFTAVMQLVEQGKLNLDRDINEYLDFHIPDTFRQPITLRSLMTHTAGFEESLKNVFVAHPDQLPALKDYVRRNHPRRIVPPGTLVAYSNYGAALAGYIVERASGLPYERYVRQFILTPLNMSDTTLEQPLPKPLAARVSQGYLTASSRRPKPFELIGASPAGAMTSSVVDLTHFAIAHLQDGEYNGTRILRPETTQMMHSQAFEPAPGLNGYALGFYEESRNGVRIIGHGGDTELFHSDLHLILPAGVAVVMSFNSNGTDGQVELVRTSVFRAFLDRYFPYTPSQRPKLPSAREDAQRVVGAYALSRRNVSSFLSLLGLFQTLHLSADPDGDIRFSFFTDLAGVPKRWREVGPLLYQEENGQALLKFVTDEQGRIRYFISDDFLPVFVYEPASSSPGRVFLVLGAALLVLLATVIVWPAAALVRRIRGRSIVHAPHTRRLRFGARVAAILGIALAVAWTVVIGQLASSPGALSAALDPYLATLYAGAWLFFAFTALAALSAAHAWMSPARAAAERWGGSAIVLACVVLCWFIMKFHLATFGAQF